MDILAQTSGPQQRGSQRTTGRGAQNGAKRVFPAKSSQTWSVGLSTDSLVETSDAEYDLHYRVPAIGSVFNQAFVVFRRLRKRRMPKP